MSGALPPGWRHGTLADVIASILAGVSVNGEDRPVRDGEVGVLKITAVLRGVFEPQHHKAVLPVDRHRVASPVRGGTVLISRSNTAELVGASAYVPDDVPGLFLPDLLWALSARDGVNARWLAYVLGDPAFRPRLLSVATGTSASMKKISQGALLTLPVAIPPRAEQDRIVAIVGTWDRGISLADAFSQQLAQHLACARNAVMAALGGDCMRLGDVANVTTGQPAPQRREVFTPEGTRFYRVSDLSFICGDADEEDPEFIEPDVGKGLGFRVFPANTVIFAKSGASASLGRVGRTQRDAFLVSHLCAVVAAQPHVASLLYHRLSHRPPTDLIQGEGFPSIRTTEVADLLVPAMDGVDAPGFAVLLDDAERRMRAARQLSANLRRQRAALLSMLMSGRQHLRSAPASRLLEPAHA